MAPTLNVTPRDGSGKSAARMLRQSGRVPAVMYGHGDETRPVSIDALELQRLMSSINLNTIIDLNLEGGEPSRALIREVQYHPTRREVLHLDLYQIHAGEKIQLVIPMRLHGNPIGVREQGGVLQQVLHEVHVECLPKDIPDTIDMNVEELGIGDALHIRDLNVPNVKILNDEDLTICSITAPTVAAEPEETSEEDTVGGSVEPELVGGTPSDEEQPDQG